MAIVGPGYVGLPWAVPLQHYQNVLIDGGIAIDVKSALDRQVLEAAARSTGYILFRLACSGLRTPADSTKGVGYCYLD